MTSSLWFHELAGRVINSVTVLQLVCLVRFALLVALPLWR